MKMAYQGLTKAEAQRCLDKCADDEPVFVVRGQDETFVPTVRFWMIENGKVDHDQIKIAEDWQDSHPTKLAD